MSTRHEHASKTDPATGHHTDCVCTGCLAYRAGMTRPEYHEYVRGLRANSAANYAASFARRTAAPAGVATGTGTAPAPATWRKVAGGWAVRAPGARCGATVTVTKRNGDTADVVLGTALGDDLYRPAAGKAEAYTAPAVADVPPGYYAVRSATGNNDLDFFKVDAGKGRWAGRTFVSRVVGGHPDYAVRGAEAAAVLARIVAAGPAGGGSVVRGGDRPVWAL